MEQTHTTQVNVLDIAKQTAELVAERMATRIRDEHRADFENLRLRLKEDIRDEILGKMHPHEHTSQHDRLEKLLTFFERIQSNFLGKIIGNLLVVGALIIVTGYSFLGFGGK